MATEKENKQKLESFFEDEYHLLKGYVRSRIRASTEWDAEDIIQDVALNLFSGAERYSPINNVAGFVYRSIRNRIIDVMRKRKGSLNEEAKDDEKLMEFAELLYGESDNSYSDKMKDELKEALLNLKEPYRDIIIAIDFEGYTYAEITNETGIPEGTLMSRRHRALAQLFKQLEHKKEINN